MEPQPPLRAQPPPEPDEPPAEARPGPSSLGRWALGYFLGGLVVSALLASTFASLWLAVTGDEELDLAGQAFSQVGLWIGMVGAVVLAGRRQGAGRLGEDFGFRARWSDLGLGVLVALGVQLLLLPGVGLLLRPLLGEPDVSEPVRDLLDKSKGAAFVGLMASVVVGAPIVEELFFRGLLLRSLQRWVPTGLAVLLSAVMFGLAHGSTMSADAVILVLISLTVFGAVLAGLAVRTGRLGPGIVAHAVFNLFTLLYLTFNG